MPTGQEQDPAKQFLDRVYETVQERDHQVQIMSRDARRFIVNECRGVTSDMDIFMLAAHGVVPGEPTENTSIQEVYSDISHLQWDIGQKWSAGLDVGIMDSEERLTKLVHIRHASPDDGMKFKLKGIRRATEGGVYIPGCTQAYLGYDYTVGTMREEDFTIAYLTHRPDRHERGYADVRSKVGELVVGMDNIYEQLRPNKHYHRNYAAKFDAALDAFSKRVTAIRAA